MSKKLLSFFKGKKEDGDKDESLFKINEEFGVADNNDLNDDNSDFDDYSDSATIGKNSKSSTMFGDMKSLLSKDSNTVADDDKTFNLKESVKMDADSALKKSTIKDLAKSASVNAGSNINITKYMKIFGITVIIFILLGSVLTYSVGSMDEIKNKFYGFVKFPSIFPEKREESSPPKPKKRKQKKTKREIEQESPEEKLLDEEVKNRHQYKPPVMPDDATSALQKSKPTGKAGWCYIGEDRGFRSCVEVNRNDTCMSGKIFENEQKCIHPELRFT